MAVRQTANIESYDSRLERIEKRRWQLWALAFLIIIMFSFTISSLSYWSVSIPRSVSDLLNLDVIRVSLITISCAFCAYIIEKEIIFKRVSRNLIQEKVRNETLDHEFRQVEALLNASKAINSVLGLKSVLDIILRSATGILDADHASIMLYNELTGMLKVASFIGSDETIAKNEKVKVGEGIAGKVFKTAQPQIINNNVDSRLFNVNAKKKAIKTAMCIPLKTKEKVIGVIYISSVRINASPFKKEDIRTLLIFAEQAATAIEKGRLFEKTKQTSENLLRLNEELQDKNGSLKKYIHDLKKANLELERFNRIIVNREIEMVRLKEKIKKLQIAR